jgi:hypothetical protein
MFFTVHLAAAERPDALRIAYCYALGKSRTLLRFLPSSCHGRLWETSRLSIYCVQHEACVGNDVFLPVLLSQGAGSYSAFYILKLCKVVLEV